MKSLLGPAIDLLIDLIKTPSLSGDEARTADIIADFLSSNGCHAERSGHNILARYQGDRSDAPYILLCSHHDTVRPNTSYTRDPYGAEVTDGKIYGLGANDAGGALVSLISAFLHLVRSECPCNLILAAVAEEEISGPGGVTSILQKIPPIDLAIVGEPTQLQMAIAEKGLIVIDATATGVPGHAAHNNSVNPILQASIDIQVIDQIEFDRISPLLGKTKATVTVIEAGKLHNQVPATCHFVIDVRVNELYTLEEIVQMIQQPIKSQLTPRSMRLRPSGISAEHKIIQVAKALGITTFGSSTLSDQALLPYYSIKIGPGDSLRSHTADEYIFLHEIEQGIEKYIQLIEAYIKK